jgi:threonine dehydratase
MTNDMINPAAIIPAAIGLEHIRDAAARIAPHAHVTPVLHSRSLDDLVGARLFFKCEQLQRVGAFKFRGACNAVWSLDDATRRARRGHAFLR